MHGVQMQRIYVKKSENRCVFNATNVINDLKIFLLQAFSREILCLLFDFDITFNKIY